MPNQRYIKIKDIETGGDTQMRERLNESTIADYAENYKDGGEMDPITVYHDGSTYWLSDGFHRLFASERAGAKTIAANVLRGTREDARWAACAANKHGLHRTNEDKRKAVLAALAHPKSEGLSDRAIAQHCGVGHPLVARLRADQVESDSTCDPPVTRTGRDGKRYPVAEKARKTQVDTDPEPEDEWAADADTGPTPWPGDGTEPDESDVPAFEAPEPVDPVHQADAPVRAFVRRFSVMLADYREFCASNEYTQAFYRRAEPDFERVLKNLKNVVTERRPHAVCGWCKGGRCDKCHNTGLLPARAAAVAPQD